MRGASVRFTRMTFGFGKNTSFISETTIIIDFVDPGGIEKKYNVTSNAMIAIFVPLSSFGMRSKDSKSVPQASDDGNEILWTARVHFIWR